MFFFQPFPFPFPLLKYFSFIFSICFFFISQKCSISQNIWCLIKTPLKNITQTIFQGGSPWATLIHNSVVFLGVHYCVQLLPGVTFFFFNHFLSLFLCWNLFPFYLASFFLESKPKAFQRIGFSQAKKTWMIRIHNSVVCLRVHYCVQLLPGVMFFFNHFLFLC